MSINATTLSAAMGESDIALTVASATGILAPNFTTGVNVTYLKVESEMMLVQSVNGTFIGVVRGQYGTQQLAHSASAPVIAGLVTDFPVFAPEITGFATSTQYNYWPIGAPLTGATISPVGGFVHHFTGTTALVTINVPAGLVSGGEITLAFDGSSTGLTWTAAGNISVAGTATAAKSTVTFYYDPSTALWYPSRLA